MAVQCFKIHDGLFIGMSGLATDIQTLDERFRFKTKMYELNEGRKMKPTTFANVVASTLYEKRFGPYFVEPVVVGLQDGKVYLRATRDIEPNEEVYVHCGTDTDVMMGRARRVVVSNIDGRDTINLVPVDPPVQ